MAAHRKGKPLDIGTEHSHPHFRTKEPQQEHAPKAITPEKSLSLILKGNLGHMSALEGLVPEDRYKKIVAGQADYLVLSCSDARGHPFDSEEDAAVGVFVRLAGNPVGASGSPDYDLLQTALSYVKAGGPVIIESHVNCGAVKEYARWLEGGQKPTGSADLDALFHEIGGGAPQTNALTQWTKARNAFGLGARAATVRYDWEIGEISQTSPVALSPAATGLMQRWFQRHADANKDGDLAEKLKKQAPHAIAICTADLPYGVATITHANQNEIFAVTGSEGGLSPVARASVLYAASHLGPKHIAFIAPGKAEDNERIMGMFTAWERDMREIKSGGNRVIANALNSGEMEISRLRYDLSNGMLVRIA